MFLIEIEIPTSLSIDDPVVLIENVESFVICRSTNGMPEAKLTWNYPQSIKTISKVDYALISDESLRNSISNLSLIANESHHGKSIQCQAHSAAIETLNRTLVTNQTIRIHFQPKLKLIFSGNENENSNVTIRCQIESRPDVYRIEWFNGTHSLQRTNQTQINFTLTRFMHRNLLICQATNQIGTTNQSIQLNVNCNYSISSTCFFFFIFESILDRPVFVENSSVVLVDEGESAKLECLVDSSPRCQISWIFKNKLLIENVESVVINKIQSKKHIGFYVCQANHSIFGLFNRTIRVALKTPPEIIEQNEIYSGYVQQSISLVCRLSKDLPLKNLFWSRQDQTNILSNHKYRINRNESKDFIQSELIIENLSMKDQGIYLCTATNQFGSSIHQIQLKIVHFKYFFFRNLFFYGSISLAILLTCVFISFIFLNYSKQHHHRQLTNKSSLTDPTNSSFHKQLTQIDDSEVCL